MTVSGHLRIGALEYRLHGPDGVAVRYADAAYGAFWHPALAGKVAGTDGAGLAGGGALVAIEVWMRREARGVPSAPPLHRGGKSWALWEDGSRLLFGCGFHGQAGLRMHCAVARDLSAAELCLDPAREGRDGEPFEAPVRFPLDQFLAWGLLAGCGGFMMHAAVAVRGGLACLFAGRSGAGKSTLAGLCHAAGWEILNDDRAMVYRREGQWKVAGNPWHGSGRFATPGELPLAGIYCLEKSEQDGCASLAPGAARLRLLDVVSVPWFEDRWCQATLDSLEAMLRSVPVQRFHFMPTPQAVPVLERHQELLKGVAACT